MINEKNVLFVVILQLVVNHCFAQVKPINLICENSRNPIGLDALQPELSWQLDSDKRNVMQTAYEIQYPLTSNCISILKQFYDGHILSLQHDQYVGQVTTRRICYQMPDLLHLQVPVRYMPEQLTHHQWLPTIK